MYKDNIRMWAGVLRWGTRPIDPRTKPDPDPRLSDPRVKPGKKQRKFNGNPLGFNPAGRDKFYL